MFQNKIPVFSSQDIVTKTGLKPQKSEGKLQGSPQRFQKFNIWTKLVECEKKIIKTMNQIYNTLIQISHLYVFYQSLLKYEFTQ